MDYAKLAQEALNRAESHKRNNPEKWNHDVDYLAEAIRDISNERSDCTFDLLLITTKKLYGQRPNSTLDIDTASTKIEQ